MMKINQEINCLVAPNIFLLDFADFLLIFCPMFWQAGLLAISEKTWFLATWES
jgi:hypothetical protein